MLDCQPLNFKRPEEMNIKSVYFVALDFKRSDKNNNSVYFADSITTLDGPEVTKYKPGSGQLFKPKTMLK